MLTAYIIVCIVSTVLMAVLWTIGPCWQWKRLIPKRFRNANVDSK